VSLLKYKNKNFNCLYKIVIVVETKILNNNKIK